MNNVPLGEIAEFINGRAFRPSEWGPNGIPIIRIQNLTGTSESFNYFDGPLEEQHRVRKGDLLISWSASLGVYVWEGSDAALNQHIFRVDLRAGVDRRYFYYAMMGALGAMMSQVHGSTMQHITKDRFEAITVPFPPLLEQKKRAQMLADADRVRRIQRYALDVSEGLLGAVFREMFADLGAAQRIPFRELAEQRRTSFVNGPFGSNLLTSELLPNGVPVIYIRDICTGRYERVSRVCVTEKKARELASCAVTAGDLLIAKVGDPPGVAAVYPCGQPDGIVTQDVIRLRPNLALADVGYLRAFLNSEHGRRVLGPIIVQGTRERFGLSALKDLQIPVPEIARQRKFSKVLAGLERCWEIHREALRQAEHFFQTLLRLVFAEAG